ncbi:MAG TPA: NADH-quinone oxidoreductase subunit J, partial [Pseudonocardia sp.]|nr:NADH-quinone oxidoreductase subunit J [Pseudonocardia sp.]
MSPLISALAQGAADTGGPVSLGEAIAFWVLGVVALAGALGMVFARNAVHSALWLAVTMLCLGALYMVQQAPFLGFVQIIVYTGAVMMLFLFVLMLVGRDSSDSVVEVLRGQRLAGAIFGLAFAVLLVGALANSLAS